MFQYLTPWEQTLIPTNKHHPSVLQDYLEALEAAANATPDKDEKLLYGYAELKYRMGGGGKCPLCRAHVRHVVPVSSTRENGEKIEYDCLCQRCLLGEIGLSTEVELRIGDAKVTYTREAKKADPVVRTFVPPTKVKAATTGN
jgi:hypothetical protein